MGNIIADFEFKEVDESDINAVENELTVIKGTNVDSHDMSPSRCTPLDVTVPLRNENQFNTETEKPDYVIDSGASSPLEFHSAHNSQCYDWDEICKHGFQQDSCKPTNVTSDSQPGLSDSCSDNSEDIPKEDFEEARAFYNNYLNPETLSDTGSEVSDFESDGEEVKNVEDPPDEASVQKGEDQGPSIDDKDKTSVGNEVTIEKGETTHDVSLSGGADRSSDVNEVPKDSEPEVNSSSDSSKLYSCNDSQPTTCVVTKSVVSGTETKQHYILGTQTDDVELKENDNYDDEASSHSVDKDASITDKMTKQVGIADDNGSGEKSEKSENNRRRESTPVTDQGICEQQYNMESGNEVGTQGELNNNQGEECDDNSKGLDTEEGFNKDKESSVVVIRSKLSGANCDQSEVIMSEPYNGTGSKYWDINKEFIQQIWEKQKMCRELVAKVMEIIGAEEDVDMEAHDSSNKGGKSNSMGTADEDENDTYQSQESEGTTGGMSKGGGGQSQGSTHKVPGSPRSQGFYTHRTLDAPQTILDVDYNLLQSGVAVLPGCRDLDGRAIIFVFTNSSLWQNQQVPSVELARLMMYYRSIPREEVRSRGLTVVAVIYGASISTINTLLETFYLLEGNCQGSLVMLHLLADQQSKALVHKSPLYDPQAPFKLNMIPSEELLQDSISLDQLPLVLDGLFVYNHEEWIRFHMALDPFMSKNRSVAKYLVCVMQELSEVDSMPKTSAECDQLIHHHRQLVKSVFNDQHLVSLQTEGESIINCLRREEVHMGHSEDYRDLMENVNKLYDHLNSTMVKLVHLADSRLTKLEQCQQLREFEEECTKVIAWTSKTGEEILQRHSVLANNLKAIKCQQKEFEKFYFTAITHIEKGNDLLEEASMLAQSGNFDEVTGYKELARTLKKHLQSFTTRLEDTRERIEKTTKCYYLLDKTYEWALDAMKYVASMKMENCESQNGLEKLIHSLEMYLKDHPVMKQETFDSMFELAQNLKCDRLLEQCRVAKARCVETQNLLNLRQNTLKRAKEKMVEEQKRAISKQSLGQGRAGDDVKQSINLGKQGAVSHVTENTKPDPECVVWEPQSSSTPTGPDRTKQELRKCVSERTLLKMRHGSDSYLSDNKPGLMISSPRHSQSSQEDLTDTFSDTSSLSPARDFSQSPTRRNMSQMSPIDPVQSPGSAFSFHNRPLKKVLKRTTTSPLPNNVILEEDYSDQGQLQTNKRHDGRTVSLITASTDSLSSLPEEEAENQENSEVPHKEWTPVPVNTHLSSCSKNIPALEGLRLTGTEKSKRTLSHIMREMVQTERDYVMSLQYIIENYIPELRRNDVPQALRGKGNIIFGNLEKIYQFHQQYFLREVEVCERNPFQIANYFLMHETHFYLYAMYNKNKPKCDVLMAEYGKEFFREKQVELGDRMDLASYLLKPVQRMGKYALLLKQIMKECPQSEQEYQDLKAAEQMVKFQLRHGNDLLAMDSLKECDVNLQEQGRLLRQDEFIVWEGRRKCLRHVFLFEDLILFSKTRRGRNGSPDTYIYKFSYKMADVGMTENYGDTGYKFEIWFRKRSKGDSYILQSQSSEIRHHWVKEISRILWNQAMKNKEKHLAEMATMGLGTRPSLDIKPSADNINDRFINVTSGQLQARTRNSIAVSSFEHFRQNNKRPHSIISVGSTSSSSSSQSGAFGTYNLPVDSRVHQHYQSYSGNESGIGTDISSGEMDMSSRNEQLPYSSQVLSPRRLNNLNDPNVKLSNSFVDSVSTDV